MSCKQGDIARVIAGPRNYGRIVQCKELMTTGHVVLRSRCGVLQLLFVDPNNRDTFWHIDGYIRYSMPDGRSLELPMARDEDLRPLGNPKEEESDETQRQAMAH